MHILLSQYNFHESFMRPILNHYIHDNHKVTILPFSFHEEKIKNETDWIHAYRKDVGKYYDDIVKPFLAYGIKEENIIWVNYFKDSVAEMKRKINQSNILLLTGGLPDKMMQRINEKGLNQLIENYPHLTIGISAGALIHFKDYFVTPDDDYDTFHYFKGLDMMKDTFYIQVHYNHSPIQNEWIYKVKKEKKKPIYAITDHGALIVENKLLKVVGDVKIFNETN